MSWAANSGITYQGRILKPDGTPLSGSNVQFRLQIRTPNANDCLMYEEVQALDMRNTNGQFSLTMADGTGSRMDSTGLGLDRIFANRGSFTFSPATCTSGSAYTPTDGDGRNLVVLFKDETMAVWEPIPAQKINFVPFAFETKQIAGFTADSLLRVVNGSGDPLTGLAPLSNAQYTALMDLVNGSSAAYTRAGQLNGVALPAMSAGEVLGWNGSAWVSQTASGGPNSVTTAMIQNAAVDSSKIATGAVGSTQIANSAVGTSQIASNVSINTTGTLGSAITTTRDFKIYAASPSTFYVGMLADPTLAASYTLTWPLTAGSANQVLTTDGSGKLTWTSPSSAGITDLTGDVTATGPGSAAATVVSVGGSAAADVHTAELAANAATSANTPNTIVKRDGSGGFAAGAVSASSVTSTGAVSGGSVASSSTITATGAISGASVAATGAVTAATVTASGAVTQGSSVFKDSGSNTVTIQAPTTVSSSYVLKWPTSAGGSGDVLTTDASGNLSWITPSGAPTGSAGGDLTGSYPNPTVATVGTSTAANIHSAEVLANAATDTNTPSTIVKRDASGNFSAGAISAGSLSSSSTITATGAISGASVTATGAVTAGSVSSSGPVTGTNITASGTLTAATVKTDTLQLNNAGSVVNVVNPIGAAYTLTLPTGTGTNGQVLTTNGSGLLSWSAPAVSSQWTTHGSNISYDGAGKVGIGTTNPAYKLDVDGPVNATQLLVNGSDISASAGAWTVAGGNVYRPSGKVSVGTSNAFGALHVNNGTNQNFVIAADGNSGDTGAVGVVALNDANSGWVPMDFQASRFGFGIGNVGIGTTNPQALLHVYRSSGDAEIEFERGNNANASYLSFVPQGALSGTNVKWLAGMKETTNAFSIASYDGSTLSQQLWVDRSGKVGIGTTSPAYKLDVAGSMNATQVCIAGSCQSSWPVGGLTNFTESVNTTAPNATVPAVRLIAANAATNVDVVLSPKGTGSILAQVPNNAVSGGNKRGTGSVDLQMSRAVNTQVVSGNNSFAAGTNNEVPGNSSIAIGHTNISNGTNSYSFGIGNTSTGTMSTAVGDSNTASGSSSAALGSNLTASSYRQVAVGTYNLPTGTENAISWVATDPLFVVGNGTGSGASRSNALMILKNGNVGIGTTAPNGKLDVKGSIVMSGATSGYTGFQPAAAAGSTIWTLPSADGTNGQVLTTNGSGVTSWTTVSGGGSGDFMKDGSVAMTGQIKAITGAWGAPGYSFSGNTNTGMFWNTSTSSLQFIEGGNPTLELNQGTWSCFPVCNSTPVGNGTLLSDWSGGTGLSNSYGIYGVNHAGPSSNQSSGTIQNVGVYGYGQAYTGNKTIDQLYGVKGIAESTRAAGTVTTMSGVAAASQMTDGSTVTTMNGLSASVAAVGGTIGAMNGIDVTTMGMGVTPATVKGVNITLAADAVDRYGVFISALMGTATNDYGIYQQGTQKNYFGGNVGIGTTAPSASLDVKGNLAISGSTSGAVKFAVPAVAGSATYTWPAAAPASNMILQSDSSGTLSWVSTGGSGLTNFTESVNTSAPNAVVPAVRLLATNAATDVDIVLSPKGDGAFSLRMPDNTTVGGTKRGKKAVDLQTVGHALGSTEVASGDYSALLGGHANTASGSYSVNIGGEENLSSGNHAVSIGSYGSYASGTYSVAIGGGWAAAQQAIAIGGTASGQFSRTLGNSVTAESYQQVSVGSYNMPKGGETSSSWVATDPLFVIGNGTGSGASRSTAMMILKNGNVGIGTTSPSAKLDVKGDFAISGSTSGAVKFVAPAVAGSATYTWPAAAPASNMLLQSDASGNLSWVSGGGGGSGDFLKDGSVAMTGPLKLTQGTSNAPGLTFSGDTNTGIYQPAADQLALVTGGVPEVTVSSSSVWVEPRLTVNNESYAWTYESYLGGTSASAPAFKGTDGGIFFPDTGVMGFATGTTERMRISSTGNVGIGTTSPQALLEVAGTIASSPTRNVASGATVDLSKGNTTTLDSIGGTSIALSNMVDGGQYTLVVRDTTSRQYTFSGCTSSYFKPTNAATTGGTRTIYGILTVKNGSNWECYITWSSGFN